LVEIKAFPVKKAARLRKKMAEPGGASKRNISRRFYYFFCHGKGGSLGHFESPRPELALQMILYDDLWRDNCRHYSTLVIGKNLRL
jgi:hypothetical protein